ncbi:hypothetical protein ABFA07_002808 [Porites harrisoni]
MLLVYWLFLISDIIGFIVATEYHIVETKTTWIQADELCKSNGSILALLDSQPKINELAERLKSLGYKNSDKFWIGLSFNVTIAQFVLSNGTKARENLDNLTCGKQKPGGNHNHYCYILQDIDRSSSPCLLGKNCQDKKYGYICQNSSTALQVLPTATTWKTVSFDVLATEASRKTLATNPSPATSSPSLEVLPTVQSRKALATSPSPEASTLALEDLPTAPSRKTLVTKPSPAPSSTTLDVLPTAPSWKAFETPLYTSSTALKVLQSTVLSSTVLDVLPSVTPWKTVDSNRASNSVKRRSDYPLLDFYRKVESLNPRDPVSLKLITDAYKDLMHSMEENSQTAIGESIMLSARAIEEFAFKYASFNLNASKREARKKNQHIVLQVALVAKGDPNNFTFSGEGDAEKLAKITLPSYLFQNQDTTVVNTLYLGLGEYVDNLVASNKRIDSNILGSSIKPYHNGLFRENVTIVLRTFKGNEHTETEKCVFWKWNYSHPNNGSWSGNGCSLVKTNGSHVVCTCNHLTNFAILMNIKPQEIPEKHKKALDFITYIGLGVSLLAETITIVAYMLLLCSNNDQQSHVHMNLVATLAMAQVIFLAGIDASQDQVLCLTVAALLHYFCLSAFCWMLIEGIMLYLLIIEVYNNELKLRLCYSFSFGIPGLVVGVTVLIAHLGEKGIYQYKSSRWCWLSTEKYYIWSFAAPVILITVINAVVFCGVVKEMVAMPSARSGKFHGIKTTVKACIVLFPLLGVTWLFGLLSLSNTGLVSQYVFTVLNTLQGLLIFLLHCIRNSEIRAAWNKKLQNVRRQAWHLFKIGRPPAISSSTPEVQSCRAEQPQMEMNRRNNKIAPVDG